MKQDLETFYIIALILAKIFFRGIYLLTLFIAIGGLLHWGLYPTMKGLRLMDFYYIYLSYLVLPEFLFCYPYWSKNFHM